MFDIALRSWKDQAVDPIHAFIPAFITPLQITFLGFGAGLMSCALATTADHSWMPLGFWLLNRGLDCLDGSLARSRKSATQLGGFVDLLCDFVVYSLIPVAVARGQSDIITIDWTAVAILEATFHINNFVLFYVAAIAAEKKKEELTSITMTPALIEGLESGFLFTTMFFWPTKINLLCWFMAVTVAVGTLQRLGAVVPVLQRLDSKNTVD